MTLQEENKYLKRQLAKATALLLQWLVEYGGTPPPHKRIQPVYRKNTPSKKVKAIQKRYFVYNKYLFDNYINK